MIEEITTTTTQRWRWETGITLGRRSWESEAHGWLWLEDAVLRVWHAIAYH